MTDTHNSGGCGTCSAANTPVSRSRLLRARASECGAVSLRTQPGHDNGRYQKMLDAAPQCCVLVSPDTHTSEVWQMFSSIYVDKHRKLTPWRTGEGVYLVRGCPIDCLAGGPGFEPRLTGSEPVVLPLNYPPPGPAFQGPFSGYARPLQGEAGIHRAPREALTTLCSPPVGAPPVRS